MKWLSKIFTALYGIGKDRYMHIVVGTLIACLSLVVFCWLPLWANLLISVIMVLAAAVIKDCVIDAQADVCDIVCTAMGGVMVWTPYIVLCV